MGRLWEGVICYVAVALTTASVYANPLRDDGSASAESMVPVNSPWPGGYPAVLPAGRCRLIRVDVSIGADAAAGGARRGGSKPRPCGPGRGLWM